MEESWEVLALPPEIEHSTVRQSTDSEAGTSTQEETEKVKVCRLKA
jgi:hypothetical protein